MLIKHLSRISMRTQAGMAVNSVQWIMAAVAAAVLLVALWYFAFGPGDSGDAASAPTTAREAVPELAREVISAQQQEQAPDYAATLEQARSLRADGNLADAQLLYFYAARGGHAPAAFELAELYDPLHFDPSASLMEQPDAFQAFKWYQEAARAGDQQASARLQDLQLWAQQAAEDGDIDAEQLLLQWN